MLPDLLGPEIELRGEGVVSRAAERKIRGGVRATPGERHEVMEFGTFTVDSLPLVSPAPAAANQPAPNSQSQSDVFTSLERLGQLHQSGILSDDEFRTKKAELLARL
jgi:hypothetical protein